MTRKEYAAYKSAVARFFQETGCRNLSTADPEPEPFFSWQPCDCCHRPLGGNRYAANGYVPADGSIWTGNVCPDCIYYAEYGQLDDMTMMDMTN